MANAKCEKCKKASASIRLRVAGSSYYLCDGCAVKYYAGRDNAVAAHAVIYFGKASK